MHAAYGASSGRSMTARHMTRGGPPSLQAAIEPILYWARGVFDALAPPEVMQAIWRRAIVQVGLTSRPFDSVAGPCGGTVAAMRRLGWSMPNWFTLISEECHTFDLRVDAPDQVYVEAKQAYERWYCFNSSLRWELGAPRL